MASQTRLLRLKLLIILLVSNGKFAIGRSSSFSLRELYQTYPQNFETRDAPAVATEDAPNDTPNKHVSSQAIYDAVLETMSLVQQLLEQMRMQGSQLDSINQQLGQQDPGGADDGGQFMFPPPLSLETWFPFFPGTQGYFSQQKKKRLIDRPTSTKPNTPSIYSHPPQFAPMNLPQQDPYFEMPMTDVYPNGQRPPDPGPMYNPHLQLPPDAALYDPEYPDVFVPTSARQDIHYPPYTQVSFHPNRKQSHSDQRPVPLNLMQSYPPDKTPPDPSSYPVFTLSETPPDLSPHRRGSAIHGHRPRARQLDFGPVPNGPADDPDLSIHNSQNPAPEGIYPPSGSVSN